MDNLPAPSHRDPVPLRCPEKDISWTGRITPVIKVAILSCGLGIIIGATAFSSLTCGTTTVFEKGTYTKPSPSPNIGSHTINLSFTYNRTFGADPRDDNGTAKAWESLVPLGQGSVRYPPNSPQVYTLSVVHQLHCLWSIHRNYYASLHLEPTKTDGSTSAHMRHCFDYLRQSLTCAADTTLEPVDPELGGVTGWGNSRICHNYSELVGWAEEHRVNNLRGFLESPMQH
ncbi:hypothetical protein F4809DRAFT_654420 [Biscogniauxia mediterranea]|nr:hypothetical protein F4809DRAFT_654420 [Biscogniauxia mediterranea]